MQFTTDSELDKAPFTFGESSLEDVHGVSTHDLHDASAPTDPNVEFVEGGSLPSAMEIQQEWVEVRPEPQAPAVQVGVRPRINLVIEFADSS